MDFKLQVSVTSIFGDCMLSRLQGRVFLRQNPTLRSAATLIDTTLSLPTSKVTTSAHKTKGRSRKPQRPQISLAHPRNWNRPLGVGVLPAYDEALKVIRRDSNVLTGEVEELRAAVKRAEEATVKDETSLHAMRKKLQIIEVQSEINLPDVRWKFANGMADMSKAVYRHLAEQRWREEGGLDLLMERIHQMNVVPDVLPTLQPSLDLRITFPTPPRHNVREHPRRSYQEIEPGIYLLPEQTRSPPRLYANVFHTDTRLYTLLMVDPDVPDVINQGFQTYVHWLQPNIPLSAFLPSHILVDSHTAYVPPHPQRGTPYHRYVLLLLPQLSATEELSIPVLSDITRSAFNVREFMDKYQMDASVGGGAHMWREVWNTDVSDIYNDVFKREEPRFGRQPKADAYAQVKSTKRYV